MLGEESEVLPAMMWQICGNRPPYNGHCCICGRRFLARELVLLSRKVKRLVLGEWVRKNVYAAACARCLGGEITDERVRWRGPRKVDVPERQGNSSRAEEPIGVTTRRYQLRLQVEHEVLDLLRERCIQLGIDPNPPRGLTGGPSAAAQHILYEALGLPQPADPHEEQRRKLKGRPRKEWGRPE